MNKKNLILIVLLVLFTIALNILIHNKYKSRNSIISEPVYESEVSKSEEEKVIIENSVEKTEMKQGEIIKQTITSESIGNNIINDNCERNFYVYLPSTYYESVRDYPVVYFLEGYHSYASSIVRNIEKLSLAMQKEGMDEFIIVNIDGHNQFTGSFYTNSPVTGNWEDFVVHEIVDYMDSNYNTIDEASGRGISGFSMGGSGAINIGLKHPEVFSCIYALSPGVFDENGLNDAMKSWENDNDFLNAYSAAFSPDINSEFPYGNRPVFDDSKTDDEIINNWLDGYGNMESKIINYLQSSSRLTSIRVDVGTNDQYAWITSGSEYLSGLLTSNDIPHQFIVFNGAHSIPDYFFESEMVYFFSKQFDFN